MFQLSIEELGLLDDQLRQMSDAAYRRPPAGQYQAVVESAKLSRSKQGAPMVVWGLRIADPPYNGFPILKFSPLSTENGDGLRIFVSDCNKLNVHFSSISELPDVLSQLEGKRVGIWVEPKDQIYNVRITDLFGDAKATGGSNTSHSGLLNGIRRRALLGQRPESTGVSNE